MALVLFGACSSNVSDMEGFGLSPEERAIYQMLALELEGFRQKNYAAEGGICVGVHRTPDSSDISAISPRIL
jgi:hypothetical protein